MEKQKKEKTNNEFHREIDAKLQIYPDNNVE